MKSWHRSKSWGGKTGKGRPDAGLIRRTEPVRFACLAASGARQHGLNLVLLSDRPA